MIKLVKIVRIFDNTTPSTSEESFAYIVDIVFLAVQDRKSRTQPLAATIPPVPHKKIALYLKSI
jgi:hypothetical protein